MAIKSLDLDLDGDETEEQEDKQEDKKKGKKAPREVPTSIGTAIALLTKKYGEGTIMQGSQTIVRVDAWPSGVATLDRIMGCGGIPRGRIIEVFGPESSGKTTLTLTFAATCQHTLFDQRKVVWDPAQAAKGTRQGTVAFIDAEHALDPTWAKNIGVDIERLIINQPSCGEEAIDVASYLVKSGECDLVIVDSVAALVPQAEIDGDMGDMHIGAQARLMSKAMRKLSSDCSATGTTVVFINQIREKVGVMFGCLHAETTINFVDGRSLPIAEVVERRIEGEVWSYNEELRTFVARPIIDWHYNGEIDSPSDYLSIALRGPGTKNGRMQLVVTPSHQVMTNDGWMPAADLVIGDTLLSKQECLVLQSNGTVNGTLGMFLTGMLSGDSHLAKSGDRRLGAYLRIRDNIDREYVRWKAEQLGSFLRFSAKENIYGKRYDSAVFSELLQLKHEYPNRDPMLLLNHFSWLGFAIWIMDDATYERGRYNLSMRRFVGNHDKIDQISWALDELGLYHHASYSGRILFDKAVSDAIAVAIAPYVPPCMAHKLSAELRGQYIDIKLTRESAWRDAYAEVIEIREASSRQMKRRGKYDISVADTCCYSAGGNNNGVIVHNSNETTPGGRALRFYASLRVDIRAGEGMSEGNKKIGRATKVKIVKNKVSMPFRSTLFNIMYGYDGTYGIDRVSDLIEAAVAAGIVQQKGSHYTYSNMKINGLKATVAAIKDNEELFAQLSRDYHQQLWSEAQRLDALSDEALVEVIDDD